MGPTSYSMAWPNSLATAGSGALDGSGSSGEFLIIISIIIGGILTSLLWIPIGPRLKRGHDQFDKMMEGADERTQAAANFNRPPAWIRNSKVGVVLQFVLIMLLVTILVYYVLSKI
ncbi:MAG: hypothetical protein MK116_08080 [Phycisphaerales bacterium]|nr:hypothetical protein [Phycisphaerales bacterium]